jgi:hypothetical protein
LADLAGFLLGGLGFSLVFIFSVAGIEKANYQINWLGLHRPSSADGMVARISVAYRAWVWMKKGALQIDRSTLLPPSFIAIDCFKVFHNKPYFSTEFFVFSTDRSI